MLSGVIASAIGTLALHPIDTIKTTQQAAHRDHNMFVTATSLVRQSGFRALYRGVSPILCSESSGGAIKFATFETIKHYCESNVDSSYHALTSFLSAAAAMLASSIILVPGEILKIRLQAGKVCVSYTSFTSLCFTSIISDILSYILKTVFHLSSDSVHNCRLSRYLSQQWV